MNQQNSQRRDVQLVQGGTAAAPGCIVLQYETDNSGLWPFHCHVAWHVSAGLYINTMEQTDGTKKKVLPPSMAQFCKEWIILVGRMSWTRLMVG
jgi:hypothetical protein